MKIKHPSSLSSAFVLTGLLAACTSSKTPDEATVAPAPTAEVAGAPASPAESTAAPTPVADEAPLVIPESADAIWMEIDKHSGELKAAIDGGALDTVHHHAFAIRDLVAALPTHSPSLPAEDQAKLEGEVKFVATLADRLDEAGDAGDKTGAQADYEKLAGVLIGITRAK
jgi:hypothetical protein